EKQLRLQNEPLASRLRPGPLGARPTRIPLDRSVGCATRRRAPVPSAAAAAIQLIVFTGATVDNPSFADAPTEVQTLPASQCAFRRLRSSSMTHEVPSASAA